MDMNGTNNGHDLEVNLMALERVEQPDRKISIISRFQMTERFGAFFKHRYHQSKIILIIVTLSTMASGLVNSFDFIANTRGNQLEVAAVVLNQIIEDDKTTQRLKVQIIEGEYKAVVFETMPCFKADWGAAGQLEAGEITTVTLQVDDYGDVVNVVLN